VSAKIGDVFTSANRSDSKVGEVWCSRAGVELHLAGGVDLRRMPALEPIAARNFAALVQRASEESERMRSHGE